MTQTFTRTHAMSLPDYLGWLATTIEPECMSPHGCSLTATNPAECRRSAPRWPPRREARKPHED